RRPRRGRRPPAHGRECGRGAGPRAPGRCARTRPRRPRGWAWAGWGRGGRAAPPSPRRRGRSSLHSLEVVTAAGVDLDAVTLVEEQRDLDLAAGGEAGGLGATAGAVALQTGLGELDLEHHGGGQLDEERVALVEGDDRVLALDHEV